MNEWYNENKKDIFKTKNGCAIIEHGIDMTTLLIKDKNGIPIDGYAQRSQSLKKEKEIAESRLKKFI